MVSLKAKYGTMIVNISMPDSQFLGTIASEEVNSNKSEEQVVIEALDNPIGTKKIEDIVNPGEKVCIVISDITRAWQKMYFYLPYIIERLNKAGIKDEDITFLSSTGSHRKHSKEEHNILLGKLSDRFTIIDHDCKDKSSLVYLGNTSFGTPVYINKIAMDCDHIILTGAIVFHDLAGWSGGKKSILPGISGYETIMANHSLSLSPVTGQGINPPVKSGNIIGNPIHQDMAEAVEFVKPSFMFNVIVDGKGNIGHAVAGHYIKAHEAGCKIVDESDRVYIKEKSDLVIVSTGGYPKDIDLYQASKALVNAKEAVREDGYIILLSECVEGFGHPEVQQIIENFRDNVDREIELRRNYTIAKFTGFLITSIAERYKTILVSSMDRTLLNNSNIRVVESFEEAINMVKKEKGDNFKTYFMPNGSSTLPTIFE